MEILYALWALSVLGGILGKETPWPNSCSDLKPRSENGPFVKENFQGRWYALVIYNTLSNDYRNLICLYMDVEFKTPGIVDVTNYLLYKRSGNPLVFNEQFIFSNSTIPVWVEKAPNSNIVEASQWDLKTDYKNYALSFWCIPRKEGLIENYGTIYTRRASSSGSDTHRYIRKFKDYDSHAWKRQKLLTPEKCKNL